MANWHLKSVEISGGFLSDLRLTLPTGLICIIGPRGSGKSTLAEALRLGLCGLPTGASKERLGVLKANLGSSLITLGTGAVSDRDGYTIRRAYGQPPTLTTSDGRAVPGVELDRGSFLPFDAYTSLEIEAIALEGADNRGDRRRALLDDLRPAELHRIQLTLADQRRALEANADAIQAARRLVADLGEQLEELGDVRGRLQSLPELNDQSASPEFKSASAQRDANEREGQSVKNSLEAIAALRASLTAQIQTAKRQIPTAFASEASANATVLADADRTVAAMWGKLEVAARDADAALADGEAGLKAVQSRLVEAHAGQDAAYQLLQQQNRDAIQAVETRSAALRDLSTADRLNKERQEAQQRLERLTNERAVLKGEYLLTRDQVSTLREEVAATLQREAGRKVRIRLQRNSDTLEYQQRVLSALEGSKTKGQDEIARALTQMPPEHLAQFIRDNDLDELEAQFHFGRERGKKILEALREKIDPLTLEILQIDDRVVIELNVAGDGPEKFKDAAELSRGQKCTALLPILLARRDSPLVIDQPEDNLDNHFIYETVVDSIRRLKPRRQMIFITHNANIPVLGEAELVVVLNSDGHRGYVEKVGTVDDCRREIIDLLEGGEEAFHLRSQRYAS